MPTTLQGSDENDNVSSLPCCLKLLIDNKPLELIAYAALNFTPEAQSTPFGYKEIH